MRKILNTNIEAAKVDAVSESSVVESPCIGRCGLGNDNHCQGCFREASEITYWSMMTNDERRDVVKRCAMRKREIES